MRRRFRSKPTTSWCRISKRATTVGLDKSGLLVEDADESYLVR
jgi:hypothetical protein